MAGDRVDSNHIEPEAARELEGMIASAAADIHSRRASRESEAGDEVEQGLGSARFEACVEGGVKRRLDRVEVHVVFELGLAHGYPFERLGTTDFGPTQAGSWRPAARVRRTS